MVFLCGQIGSEARGQFVVRDTSRRVHSLLLSGAFLFPAGRGGSAVGSLSMRGSSKQCPVFALLVRVTLLEA
jgi:hypothetical protein